MPVFKGLPEVKMTIYATHEQWEKISNPTTITPSVYKLELGEHTGTNVDALNHMGKEFVGQSIETMPLSMFYTEGICLDFSHKGLSELIEPDELEHACIKASIDIKKGDTVLLYTDHYRKFFGTENWNKGPGVSSATATWLGKKKFQHLVLKQCRQECPKFQTRKLIKFVVSWGLHIMKI